MNLIGEHTDYNGGYVMPCAISSGTRVVARERSDRIVFARSGFADNAEFDLDRLPARRSGTWTDYLRGLLIELVGAGVALRGADVDITADVPIGAGLSSSASLEISLARALLAVAQAGIDLRDLARLAQRAEARHVGTRCGIMDQYAVLFGRKGKALFLDACSLQFELLDVPDSIALVICNTMAAHRLSEGAYNERRLQCEQSVAALQARFPQLSHLRDVSPERLEDARTLLSPLLYRRALHVVSENARVLEARAALVQRDVRRFGELMNASHRSLRDDFEVSCPELDTMVSLAQSMPGVYGARMTGGGFGGCTVNMVDAAVAADFRRDIARAYWQHTGVQAEIYDGTPSDGADVARD